MKVTTRTHTFLVLVASVLVVVVSACGTQAGVATSSTPNNHSPASTATASPPPAGGLVPVQLRGIWSMVDGYAPGQKLTLTQDTFRFLQARGSVVVNGDEMDVFQSPGCMAELGYDAVGRYQWKLSGNVLRFSALNADPCDRKNIFDGISFTLLEQRS